MLCYLSLPPASPCSVLRLFLSLCFFFLSHIFIFLSFVFNSLLHVSSFSTPLISVSVFLLLLPSSTSLLSIVCIFNFLFIHILYFSTPLCLSFLFPASHLFFFLLSFISRVAIFLPSSHLSTLYSTCLHSFRPPICIPFQLHISPFSTSSLTSILTQSTFSFMLFSRGFFRIVLGSLSS